MATVAILALAAPAAAQDQAKPDDTVEEMQKTPEQAGQASEPAQPAAETPAQPGMTAEGEEPPAMAEEPAEEMAEEPAMTEEPAEEMAEEPVEEAEQDAAEEAEATPPADMTFIEVQDEAQFLADDEVIGKDVVNMMDEEVGTIADLVMDQDQKLVGVVLSVGGFLGIGDKWVAVPVDQIDFPTDDQPARLLVAVTKEQLENAPDFVTRDVVEAEQAAAEAQQQMQQQQVPPPATSTQ
ncbi:MAG TPA: PRC-barrel domain-containing protein [Geminicoccaceae bacterium]|nr:PRC-barrel domain-containing protein [Geminicoccaceae bacterium]